MNKKESIIKFIIKALAIFPIIAIFGPILNCEFSEIKEIFTKDYWASLFIFYLGFIVVYIYFVYLIPRKSIMINDWKFSLWQIIIAITYPIWFVLLIYIAIVDINSIIKIILLILVVILAIVCISLTMTRVVIYKEKHILIINSKIRFYKIPIINDILITKLKKKTQINIIINNQNNYYLVRKMNNKLLDQLKVLKEQFK